MKNKTGKRRLRSVITWILWALLVQFMLINISAASYAYKLTHLRSSDTLADTKQPSHNIFARTWRLFTGPAFYKQPLTTVPDSGFSVIALKTGSGFSVELWLSKIDSASKGIVILFHGLMGNKGLVMDEAMAFKNLGYSVMMVDARNHGHSGGNITTIGYKESEEVKLAFDYARQIGESTVYLWGTSMGAVAILKAVADYSLQPSGIIIEMPFLSLQSHLKGRARILGFPEQPFAFLTSCWIGIEQGFNGPGFTSTKNAKKIHCPVLMQYGAKDELVLRSETDAIFRAIPSTNKKLVIYDDAGHESLLRIDPVSWKQEMKMFLK